MFCSVVRTLSDTYHCFQFFLSSIQSHMSDITEDRTYKLPYNEQARPRVVEKPRYADHKPPRAYEGEYGEQQSAGVGSSKKLSVAERARKDAERSSNSVTVRASPANSPMRPARGRSPANSPMRPARGRSELPRRMTDNEARSSTVRSRSESPSVASRKSFFARVGTRVVTAIDKSVLGVPNQAPSSPRDCHENDEEDYDDDRSRSSRSSGSYDSLLESSSEESSFDDEQSRQIKKEIETPLAERQRIQREKQLEFLKQQGLLKDGTEASLPPLSVEKKTPRRRDNPRRSDNDTSFEAAGH